MATQTKLLTYDYYRSLPDDGRRYEIIEGELLMRPSPNSYHQIISSNLFKVLEPYVSERNLGLVLYAPLDVVLSMRDVVQPDLMFISNERLDIIAENNIVEALDLVVEILSEATKTTDRTSKKRLYQRYGVREYWIVDPLERTIEQYILKEQTLELNGTFEPSKPLISSVIEGFKLPTDKVFSNQ